MLPFVNVWLLTAFWTSNLRIGGAAQESPRNIPPGPFSTRAGDHLESSNPVLFQPACTGARQNLPRRRWS